MNDAPIDAGTTASAVEIAGLEKWFGSSAEMWYGLQMEYDLAQAEKHADKIKILNLHYFKSRTDQLLSQVFFCVAAMVPTRAQRTDQPFAFPRPQRRRAHADSPGDLADSDVVHADTPRHDARQAAGTLSDPVELVTVE